MLLSYQGLGAGQAKRPQAIRSGAARKLGLRNGMERFSTAGRIYLVFIGLATALLGLLFCWLMGRSYLRAHAMRSWPEIPCVILASEISERRIDPNSAPEFQFSVQYGYEWRGQAFTGDHYTWRGSSWSSRKDDASELVKTFAIGSRSLCRVDLGNPSFAVLKMDSQAAGYSIWFPGLFVIGGLGIAGRALFRK